MVALPRLVICNCNNPITHKVYHMQHHKNAYTVSSMSNGFSSSLENVDAHIFCAYGTNMTKFLK